MPKRESRVAARGARFTLEYACDASGRYPAEEFVQGLENDAKRRRDLAGLLHLFQVYADQGKISNREHFKKLQDVDPTLLEFKKHQVRVLGFFNGAGILVLTSGFIKKSDKIDQAEIDRAHRIRREHLQEE